MANLCLLSLEVPPTTRRIKQKMFLLITHFIQENILPLQKLFALICCCRGLRNLEAPTVWGTKICIMSHRHWVNVTIWCLRLGIKSDFHAITLRVEARIHWSLLQCTQQLIHTPMPI